MDDIALDRTVNEYTITDKIVVIKVSADERRTKMDDYATDVDHQDAEDNTAEASSTLGTYIMFAEGIGFAANHCHNVETRGL